MTLYNAIFFGLELEGVFWLIFLLESDKMALYNAILSDSTKKVCSDWRL